MVRDEKLLTDELAEAIGGAAEPLSASSRANIRERVMHEASATSRGGIFVLASHRLAVAGTALALGFGGVAYAAERSLPGDALYGLKIAAENAVVAVLPPGRLENRLLVTIAARRAGEAARLAREGSDTGSVDAALGSLREAVRNAASDERPLTDDDADRIRERGADAPRETRDAIEQAVTSPGPTDTGDTTGGAPRSGAGSGPGSGSQGDTGTGGDASGSTPDSGAGGDMETSDPTSGTQERTRDGQTAAPGDDQLIDADDAAGTDRTGSGDNQVRSR